MKYFAGLMTLVLLAAGATVGGYRIWDKATNTRQDNGGVLGGDIGSEPQASVESVSVQGHVTVAHIEGARLDALATPFTVTPSARGTGGATFTPVEVNGEQTSIDWQAGQPLPLTGEGVGLAGGAVTYEVGDVITIVLDGVHALTPGDYSIRTSVAVGPTPRDSVNFTATAASSVEFREGQTTPFEGPQLVTLGVGNVTIEGDLTLTFPDGSTKSAPSIALDNGEFQLTLTPDPNGGYTIDAQLIGPTR